MNHFFNSCRSLLTVTMLGLLLGGVLCSNLLAAEVSQLNLQLREWNKKTFNERLQAAQKDDSTAMISLALAFQDGQGTPVSYQQASNWLQRSISKDNPIAYYELGMLKLTFLALKPTEQEAQVCKSLFQKALKAGCASANHGMFKLFFMHNTPWFDEPTAAKYLSEGAMSKDPACLHASAIYLKKALDQPDKPIESREWWQLHKLAADQNYNRAVLHLGQLQWDRRADDPQAVQKAYYWFRKSAQEGSPEGMIRLASVSAIHGSELGIPDPQLEFSKWINQAISLGSSNAAFVLKQFQNREPLNWKVYHSFHPPELLLAEAEAGLKESQFRAAEMFRSGQGFKQSPQDAAHWYAQLAKRGDARGMLRYGECLEKTYGVTQNMEEAAQWYQKASLLSQPGAALRFAKLITTQRIKTPDKKALTEWLKKCTDSMNIEESFTFGNWYLDGTYVDRDIDLGIALLQRASLQGNAQAQNRIGELHATGLVGTPDYRQAHLWFRSANTNQSPAAHLNIAKLHLQGLGVKTDFAKAWIHASIAQENGNAEADTWVKKATAGLPAEQLTALQNHLVDYRKNHPKPEMIPSNQWASIVTVLPLMP